jgi:hypothetical protein
VQGIILVEAFNDVQEIRSEAMRRFAAGAPSHHAKFHSYTAYAKQKARALFAHDLRANALRVCREGKPCAVFRIMRQPPRFVFVDTPNYPSYLQKNYFRKSFAQ